MHKSVHEMYTIFQNYLVLQDGILLLFYDGHNKKFIDVKRNVIRCHCIKVIDLSIFQVSHSFFTEPFVIH